MTEQLLYVTKVGAAVQKMGGRGVTKAVRADIGGTLHGPHESVHHLADLPLVDPSPTAPKEDRRRLRWPGQSRPAVIKPGTQGRLCR